MRDLIRVLVLGTGQMGSGIARLVLQKRGLELVAAYGKRAERAGMDLGRAIGLDQDIGIQLSTDLSTAIEQTRPHRRYPIRSNLDRLLLQRHPGQSPTNLM